MAGKQRGKAWMDQVGETLKPVDKDKTDVGGNRGFIQCSE